MKKHVNLLEGDILKGLIALSLPIMGTSFMQMSHNLVNMFWISKLGSHPVAAIGTAGFFVWLCLSLIRLVQTGTEVKVAQSIGAGDSEKAASYGISAIWMTVLFALVYTVVMFALDDALIGFFQLNNSQVIAWGIQYLNIISIGMIFSFLNPVMSCIYNGSGKSSIPFKANAAGLVLNILLDPFLIFETIPFINIPGLGLGVAGAAAATVISQGLVTVYLGYLLVKQKPFASFQLLRRPNVARALEIGKLGLPVAVQSGLFTLFAILIARVISSFGAEAIAAQKVGVQVEAISYMTANGFAAAVAAFTGQNYGAGNYNRVLEGVKRAGVLMGIFGLITTLILYIGAKPIFSIFIDSGTTLEIGIAYLQILAYSQMFMCIEITLAGFFNGLGKTKPPAIMSILFTGLRVPAAYLLSAPEWLGLDGVWWAISLSSIIKGCLILVMTIGVIQMIRHLKQQQENPATQ